MKYFLAATVGVLAFFTFATLQAATVSFVISSPSGYQVFQRGANGLGDIQIRGTYMGTSTAGTVEASWKGRPFVAIATLSSSGAFTGTLPQVPGGQGTLLIRLKGSPTESISIPYVGIGDIYVITGQSNASGRGVKQAYSHPTLKASMFGNDDKWQELVDPVDTSVGQIDSVSADIYTDGTVTTPSAKGSPWPLLATKIMAHENVPVAFVPAARGGTVISEWQPGTATTTLYGSMARRIRAAGPVKAVLYYQGETDAARGTTRETYLSSLRAIAQQVTADFHVPFVAGQIGNLPYPAPQIDALRLSFFDAWGEGFATPGPVTPDVDLGDDLRSDRVHFTSPTDLSIFATRWWAALERTFYGGRDGRGPRFAEAMWGPSRSEIFVTFTDESLPIVPPASGGAFTVKSGGSVIPVTSVSSVSNDKLKLVLSAQVSGSATLSLGSGITGINAMPTDSSTYRLPAEVFIDQPVKEGPVTTPGVTYSGTPAEWVPVQASIQQDAEIYTLTENTVLEQHRMSHLLHIPSGLTSAGYWSFSAVVKPLDSQRSQVQVSIANGTLAKETISARCDLSGTGAVKTFPGAMGTVSSASVETLSDGWYRCSITGRPGPTEGTRLRPILTMLTAQGALRYQGNGTSSLMARDFSLRGAPTLEELPDN